MRMSEKEEEEDNRGRRVGGFHVIMGMVMCDTGNLHHVWENRGDRADEGRLVIMSKIEMSAITDH